MENKKILAGIDIGTTKIAVVIAEWNKENNKTRILGFGQSDSKGLKKGVVVDMEQTIKSLNSSVKSYS